MRTVRGGYDMSQPWPESLYREAVIILNAEAGYKLTAEEVNEEAEKRRKAMPQEGFVAGRARSFWAPYIHDGQLDTEAVVAAGFLIEEQLPEKIEEMQVLGWLGEAEAVDDGADDANDTQPLEEPPAETTDAV